MIREKMLRATEQLLMKHGASRITVTEVAKACDMSQSNAYRFFPSKNALFAGVAARWFQDLEAILGEIADAKGDPEERLHHFLLRRFELKRKKYEDDPALFEAYLELATDNKGVVDVHLERMRTKLHKIVEQCVAQNIFDKQPDELVELIELLSTGLYNPWIISKQYDTTTREQVKTALAVVISGLKPDSK